MSGVRKQTGFGVGWGFEPGAGGGGIRRSPLQREDEGEGVGGVFD